MRILSAPAADFDITRPCRANQDGAVILWRRRFAYPAIPIPSDCMVSSKSPDKAKIIIGLSGGVDSAVAAALLIEQGRDVEALFMKNWEEDDTADYCAAEADLADAEQVAQRLGIPLHTVNFASEYWDRVFEHFLAQYQAGNTPNPDVLCNSEIKFKAFLDHARALGADRIATGHYAVTQRHDGLTQLRRAQDAEKDQTYFLHALTQAQLAPVDFPLGERRKPDVRKLARSLGLANHAKKDSTGICFIGEQRLRDFLQRFLPAQPGDIATPDGDVIGRHQGLMYYTIGQRRGLGIGGLADPLYVVELDVDKKHVIVGPKELLKTRIVPVAEVNWLGDEPLTSRDEWHLSVKVRSTRPPREAILRPINDKRAEVELLNPEEGVSPGQACVFYDTHGSRIYGGGWITKRA